MAPSEKIISLITNTFPDNWYNKFHFDDEVIDDSVNVYASFLEALHQSKEKFFNHLNTSILVGEYISTPDFNVVINQVKLLLNNIPQPLPSLPDLQEKLQNDLNINYIQCLKVALNMYSDFTVWVSVKLKLSNVDHISQSNEELSESLEKDEFDDISYKQLQFVFANLTVSRKDHYQTPDIDDYRQLVTYSTELLKPSKLGGNKFSLLLKEKNDFLLCKWILRKKDINKFPIYHIKNSVEQELNIGDLIKDSFKPWIDIIRSHYGFDSEWKQSSYGDFNTLKNKSLHNLTILELHRLIRYFKDVSKSQNNLNQIRLEIQKRYDNAKEESNSYNGFVYSILINYAFNNELSLLIESKDKDEILKLYKEIVDVQLSTGIKNFFPQNRVVEYLIKLSESKFDDKTALIDLKDVREIIVISKQIIEKYRANVIWSERNYNYVFYLPFEECFINTGNSDIKSIFIASSFVLPLDKTKYIQDFDKFTREIDRIETSLRIIENIASELQSLSIIKGEVIEVKKDLVAKEMKSMETIAIFTTIVTFVLGSVANFKFISTAYQAALFVLCLATSLGFFVFLLIIIRQGDIADKIRRYFWNLCLLAVLGALFWTLLIFSVEIKHLIHLDPVPKKTVHNSVKKTELKKNISVDVKIDTIKKGK